MKSLRLRTLVISIGAFYVLVAGSTDAAQTEIISYPALYSGKSANRSYVIQLLKLALEKAGVPYSLQPIPPLPQERSITQLEAGKDLRILWAMTNADREQRLLPIRIPIYKGLAGWRVAMVAESRPNPLTTVTSLSPLKQLKTAQGWDWPDTKILEGNGLSVYGVTDYNAIYRMLDAGRIDFYPRAVNEVYDEIELLKPQGVVLDQNLLIHYPTASYFFLNKRDHQLAAQIESGLEKAIKDGSFDRLFLAAFGDNLRRLNLDKRTVIELKNPNAPPDNLLARKALWFTPAMLKRTKSVPRSS